MSIPFIEENDQTIARRQHLDALRELVGDVYPHALERRRRVNPNHDGAVIRIVEKFQNDEADGYLNRFTVRRAGRIASPPRVMGKAAVVNLSDGASRLQVYIRK